MSTKSDINPGYDDPKDRVGGPSQDDLIKQRSASIGPMQRGVKEQEFTPEFGKVEERPGAIAPLENQILGVADTE